MVLSAPDNFGSLSLEWQERIREMQRMNFGWLEGLVARNGELLHGPQFNPVPEFKLDSDSSPCPQSKASDFALRAKVRRLIEKVTTLPEGTTICIEVKHGLPFRVICPGLRVA